MDKPDRSTEIAHFMYKLIPPRPGFPGDMTEAEAGVMGRHFGYWQRLLDEGVAVVYGPVSDPDGTWGLAVVEAEGEGRVRSLADEDPAVSSGMCTYRIFAMGDAIVRPLVAVAP
jgi:uncharacterized protein YciI